MHANRSDSFESAMSYLDSIKDIRATHNCWAYRGKDENEFRVSDDGEPSMTAGKPILVAIDGINLVNTMVVVTRYFGGVKLGTGGLIRAYQGTTRSGLAIAEQELKIADYMSETIIKLVVPMDSIGNCYHIISKYGEVIQSGHEVDFSDTAINLELIQVRIVSARMDEFKRLIMDTTKGQARFLNEIQT